MNDDVCVDIIFQNEEYTFSKLLGVSLLERNLNFLNLLNIKHINIRCNLENKNKINKFIKEDCLNKDLMNNFKISFNLTNNNMNINILSNDLFDYKFEKKDRSINLIKQLIKEKKILNIDSRLKFTEGSRLLFQKIDKLPAEKIFFFTNYINRPLGKLISKILLNTNISPNQVSSLVLVTSLIATFFLFSQSYFSILLSVFFYQLSCSLDCVDGPIARLKYQTSILGHYIDSFIDKLIKILFYLGIGINLMFEFNNKLYLVLSLYLIFINILIHYIDFIFLRNINQQTNSKDINTKLKLKNVFNSDLNIIGIGCILILFKFHFLYLFLLVLYFSSLFLFFIYKIYCKK